MVAAKFWPVILKQALRQKTRSSLTIAGVALMMVLFGGVRAMQAGVEEATRASADESHLVVYRKDRYCPATSRLPQSYMDRLRAVPGVASVVPVRVVVNNCRTALDVVTFRGVPEDAFAAEYAGRIRFVAGSLEDWQRRSDAVLLGETLAGRRRLNVGDRFEAAGITVYVAGIIESDEAQHENIAYAHLSFIQYATGGRQGGYVTQFDVRAQAGAPPDSIAAAIDREFAKDTDPTFTQSAQSFVAGAAKDIVEIAGFTRWLGWAALAAVMALVSNAVFLAVRQRVTEHAVLQTLGFEGGLLARWVVTEGLLLSMIGGVAGCSVVVLWLAWGQYSISVEGVSIPIRAGFSLFAQGAALSAVVGIVAGLVPAWEVSRREIATCFRTV